MVKNVAEVFFYQVVIFFQTWAGIPFQIFPEYPSVAQSMRIPTNLFKTLLPKQFVMTKYHFCVCIRLLVVWIFFVAGFFFFFFIFLVLLQPDLPATVRVEKERILQMLVESINDKAKERAEKETVKRCKIEKFFGNY